MIDNRNSVNQEFQAYQVKNAIKIILNSIEGTTVLRKELEDTPDRVFRAYQELFDGYKTDIPSLFRLFDEPIDQLIAIRNVNFTSFCEHHLLPFFGKVHVVYLPDKDTPKVIGASKIPRIVNAFAHRLQIQERLAQNIADAINDNLHPRGVGVIIEGTHSCITCRGIKNEGAELVNSVMLGVFRTESAIRLEALAILGLK